MTTSSGPGADVVGEARTLSGWGGRPRSTALVTRPGGVVDLMAIPEGASYVPRGLGRSYGDAAQLSGGTVIDMTALAGVHLDAGSGRVTAGAGASLGDVIDTAVPRGWFLPVTPGTRHVTVGGAIAADVHGKNHHRDGSLGIHVNELRLLTGGGEDMTVGPGDPAFEATVGGMGLTGVIVEATFDLLPIESAWMRVDTLRGDDLAAVMDGLLEADGHHSHSVAWLDLEPGRKGRGIVLAGDHASADELPPSRKARPLRRRATRQVPVPSLPAGGRIVGASVGAFNRLWFGKAPRSQKGALQTLDDFFYPLDRLAHWRRLYGPTGFLQYQFVVPTGSEDTLLAVGEMLTRAPTPVSLAVLKRMGRGDGGPLSFPLEGWTMSADMPLGDPSLGVTLDACDGLVAEAGGRVYLAKDSRTRRDLLPVMYPRLDEWRELKARLDPHGRVRSDLSDRLALTG